MSTSERRSREDGCELRPYTNWPLILGAMAVVAGGAVGVGLMPRQTAEVPAKPRYQRVAETPVPRLPARAEADPAPVIEEEESSPRSVVVEHVETLGTPRVETAASLALERMTFDRVAPSTLELRSGRLKLPVLSEAEMLRLLLDKSKEIDIGKDAHTSLTEKVKALPEKDKKVPGEGNHRALSDLVQGRTDLYGLPLVAMKDCVLSRDEGKALATVSRAKIRTRGSSRSSEARERHGSTATIEGGPLGVLHPGARLSRGVADTFGEATTLPTTLSEEHVRPLRQVYQVQPEKSRIALAQVIAKSKSPRAARALVQLAVFDLSEAVRDEAVKQLPSQDVEAVRAELLDAFRHPWAPAAAHAAKAADRLGDRGMVPALKAILDQPDPSEPFREKNTWYVRELVRVNHLKNCLLCHPAAESSRPVVSGPVPLRDKEIPVVYYASRSKGVPLVDASTVYLRQDFSVLHEVKDAKPWPEVQRFDYLVRTRPLRADEIPKKKAEPAAFASPQREAVRALLEVLGEREPEKMRP